MTNCLVKLAEEWKEYNRIRRNLTISEGTNEKKKNNKIKSKQNYIKQKEKEKLIEKLSLIV